MANSFGKNMEARYMNGNRKGSAFERSICKRLSLWWSKGIEGTPRDDVFWRSSQSGGRATFRGKKGKSTSGSYGDITAIDVVGVPLLRLWTLELKRGKSHGDIGDMLDLPNDAPLRPFEETLLQAHKAAQDAGSLSWLLICRRDRRKAMVYGTVILREFSLPNCWTIKLDRPFNEPTRIVFLPLSTFLRHVKPVEIVKLLKHLKP